MIDFSKMVEEAVAELKRRLASGESLGDALRTMFHDDGFGLRYLYNAVSLVQSISKKDAMKIVVHETESWAGRCGNVAHGRVDKNHK